ncbi:metallophosphoesterase [Rhodothermus marinus]|uniref:metallophosphoesterase n=1 Tax=Rhodothermus marinus TaxID=29549 RepID=UPI000A5F907E|nr:metallophosphoesterase [Rhodothermus marinus]
MVIVHLSDLHFGRLASRAVVEDLLVEVRRQAPDLVVISGDLTQRARPRQFRAARAFLERCPRRRWWCPATTMSTPGGGR